MTRRKWLILFLLAFAAWILVRLLLFQFPEEEKQLRNQVGQTIKETFPEQAARASETYGLQLFGAEGSSPASWDSKKPSVILIHGLDDPGKVWMNLAPVLADQGRNVWIMNYPNDQAITESAQLFFDELINLRATGVDNLSIVGHSMGGLVTREMLTSPTMGASSVSNDATLPRVTHFIMVGTPNHGSELSRMRFFGEIRDQWIQIVQNGGSVLGGFLDGAGEAGIDLRPGSVFLNTLNARPMPADIETLIIAGVISPWDEPALDEFLNSTLSPDNALEARSFIQSMSDGLGDGLVTVESTRLDGVPHVTVPGTHLSMIRNVLPDSERIPPSVPLIVDFLGQPVTNP